jgi:general secretion pathway protein G
VKTNFLNRHAAGANRSRRASRGGGFTLIELMVVITIIIILIGIAAARYDRTVQRAKEAVLMDDLHVMRNAIDNYTLDKQAAPQSLDDLVQDGYLREVPTDPMTQAKDWSTETDNTVLSPDQSTVGIAKVHSGSPRVSPFNNIPYSQW